MSSRLQLKRDEENQDDASCPSCGAAMAADAVVCLACGYDKRTGRRADDAPPPRNNPIVLAVLGILIVGALGVTAYRLMGKPAAAPESPAPQAPAAPVEAPVSAPAPEPTVATPVETNAAPEAPAAAAEPAAAETPEPEPDGDALAAEQRAWAAAQVDKVAPMFSSGEHVELRLTNGIVQRGVFRGVEEDGLRLETAATDVRLVPLASLDRGTRVRADSGFRDRYIEFRARQRAQELQKLREAAP